MSKFRYEEAELQLQGKIQKMKLVVFGLWSFNLIINLHVLTLFFTSSGNIKWLEFGFLVFNKLLSFLTNATFAKFAFDSSLPGRTSEFLLYLK